MDIIKILCFCTFGFLLIHKYEVILYYAQNNLFRILVMSGAYVRQHPPLKHKKREYNILNSGKRIKSHEITIP